MRKLGGVLAAGMLAAGCSSGAVGSPIASCDEALEEYFAIGFEMEEMGPDEYDEAEERMRELDAYMDEERCSH